jgi:hypothetical protein
MRTASQQPSTRHRSPGEQGSAMLVVSTILVALLAGGGIALYLQLESTKSASLTKSGKSSLYCAEAGLAASRGIISLNYFAWPTLLDGDASNDPPWYPIRGDIDGDGKNDYEVTVLDNDDEVAPADNDPAIDSDEKIFVVSKCLQNPEVPRQVMELVEYGGGGHIYKSQAGGGAGNTGNLNTK